MARQKPPGKPPGSLDFLFPNGKVILRGRDYMAIRMVLGIIIAFAIILFALLILGLMASGVQYLLDSDTAMEECRAPGQLAPCWMWKLGAGLDLLALLGVVLFLLYLLWPHRVEGDGRGGAR